jgi:hypothetical protein
MTGKYQAPVLTSEYPMTLGKVALHRILIKHNPLIDNVL